MLEQLETLYQQASREIGGITDSEALTEWESQYLGKKGSILNLVRGTGQLPKEERADFGKRANVIKDELLAAYETRATLIKEREMAQSLEEGEIDVTLPGRAAPYRWNPPGEPDPARDLRDLGGYGLSGVPHPRGRRRSRRTSRCSTSRRTTRPAICGTPSTPRRPA